MRFFAGRPASLFGSASASTIPFYDAWERAYAGEVQLRSFGKKAKSESGGGGGSSAGALDGPAALPDMDVTSVRAVTVTPRRTPSQSNAAMMGRQTRSKEDQEQELQRLAEQKRKWEELETERKRAIELQELAARDPMRAQREWEKDQKKKWKRERELTGAAAGGEGAGEGPEKKKEKKKKEKQKGREGGAGDVVTLKANVAEAVMRVLKPFLVEGRIGDRDSFKHLTRKLVKELVQKEEKRGNTRWHVKLGPAVEKYALQHMERLKAKGVLCYQKK